MYAEHNDVPVHRVQGCTRSTINAHGVRGMYTEYGECTWSMGNLHRVRKGISLYAEYKLSMSYDTELPQPDNDL